MASIKDFTWHKGITAKDLVGSFGNVGLQSSELHKAAETIIRMKKASAKIYLTFTSNLVTSGLRGFFAQLIRLGLVDAIVTTVGGLEEDVMKAKGEQFDLGTFESNDYALYEKGINRVGNIQIKNESYAKFEECIIPILEKSYIKKKRWAPCDLLASIGGMLTDKDSILYQASKHNIPVFCPAITDGAFGFHLFMLQQKYPDFVVDVVQDFKRLLLMSSQDELKGLIALGGGVSKHFAILGCLLNGGLNYAVYMTTARHTSGSLSGATTNEAKSWGKIKDDADAVTVIGDVSITFPLVMAHVLETLTEEGLLND
ncbi:deoxyhypusine synthase [archaeon]|nr:deoxyhypusine synthase [archaeon]|tara:strand:+ start:382 stop:1323 length:942 start_codon:yes stop_codon:yes gene_type:complete